MTIHHVTLFLHLVGVITWVGGMALAYLCLRPAAAVLPPPQRLTLWADVLARFFPLVWGSIALILFSGLGKLLGVGFAAAPPAWHLMLVVGVLMIVIFISVWFGPWARLKRAVADEDWAAGAGALNQIRQRVALNLVLGFITVAIATLGLAWR